MEILKDASATAIYGAQGANGVILITTKRGKAGEAKFTYDGMLAVQRQTKRLDMMNLREFANYYNEFVQVGELDVNGYYADPSILGKGTNWQDAVSRLHCNTSIRFLLKEVRKKLNIMFPLLIWIRMVR